MTTLETISAALELVHTKKENLKKAYDDLQAHSSLLSSSSFPLTWSNLDSHFTSIHNSLTQRFHHLRTLESQTTQHHAINPNDPSPSSSKPQDPNPEDANFSSLPNDPSPFSSTPQDPNPKNAIFSSLPKDPSPSSSKPPEPNPKDGNFSSLPNDPSSVSNPVSQNVNHSEELSALCRKMNGKGLRDYVTEHWRDKVSIKVELQSALKCARDPAAMLLDSMDGFLGANAMKDGEIRRMKRSCSLLFQQLRVVSPNVSVKVRKKAKTLAAEWKGNLLSDTADAVGAMAFLHFVAAYGLLSELNVNELATLSAMAATNDELSELYQIIGLTDKAPGLVQKLLDKGKCILAVKYIFEFNLGDRIPPVPILKAYLNEAEKLATRLSQEGKSVGEIRAREMHALKSVLKVIENHNLESEFPRASLEQRIEQLKTHKAPVKHAAPGSAAKPPQQQQQQSGIKRPRISAPVVPAAVLNNVDSASSTMHHYQQPLIQSTGLLPEHPNPYMSLPATPFGMVAPNPSISPYTGPSTGPYGLAGVPMGPSGNPGQDGSHPNLSEPHVPSGYYDRVSAYGLAGVPMGPSGNPGQDGSHPNLSEPHVPSGYYDRVSAYGLAGVPMGPSGNPGQDGSLPTSSEPHVPSGYYDRVSAYGAYGLQHYYQPSYPH